MKILKTLTISALLFSSLAANAAFLNFNTPYGTNTATQDLETGKIWLDLTISQGQSYDYVSSQLESGGVYEGWRRATWAELRTLLNNFELKGVSDDITTVVRNDIQPYEIFQSYLGVTSITIQGKQYKSSGYFYSEEYNPSFLNVIAYKSSCCAEGYYVVQQLLYTNVPNPPPPRSVGNLSIGTYLVRDTYPNSYTPVPVPSAAWLFGSSLGAIFTARRLRYKIKI